VNPARVVVVVELSTDAEGPIPKAVRSNELTPNPVTALPRVTVEGVQEIVAVPSPWVVSVTDVGPWGTAWTGVEAAEFPTALVANTENVYESVAFSPVTVAKLLEPATSVVVLVVWSTTTTVYPVIGEPPSEAGAV
jgi:hypothetical protein